MHNKVLHTLDIILLVCYNVRKEITMKKRIDTSRYKGRNNNGVAVGRGSLTSNYRGSTGRVLPKHVAVTFQREAAIEDSKGHHGNFCCSGCSNYYGLSFGRYGKVGSFGEEQYICLDCIERLGNRFIRL